ncbi:uncharacterized protein LOC134187855 isoform X2 [Corticium candelabrum]|uniref:uncharacterized protein LOC134187855 isoform X2 n=1 Tax=Corticium candelabrum TaxID=121492 RepID=UPI002E25D2AA|nr:uncharacterized protein LOC134187855 isoform X2 [Corticium candelabrum]
MFQYSLSFLLLLAAFSSSLSASSKAAKLQLDRLDMNHISGLIHDGQPDACSLKFDVGADKKYIKSTVTTKNLRTGETIELTTLTLPKTIRRVIPGMRNTIVAAAANTSRMLAGHAGAVCANVAELYAQLPNLLYSQTNELGRSQVRYSTMYHTSILSAAQRLQHNASSVCTTSPEHELGIGMFMCLEDLAEHKTPSSTTIFSNSRTKRACMKGSARGCCGNYSGCCIYSHWFCWVHDALCDCCGSWWCGWQCKKGKGCK